MLQFCSIFCVICIDKLKKYSIILYIICVVKILFYLVKGGFIMEKSIGIIYKRKNRGRIISNKAAKILRTVGQWVAEIEYQEEKELEKEEFKFLDVLLVPEGVYISKGNKVGYNCEIYTYNTDPIESLDIKEVKKIKEIIEKYNLYIILDTTNLKIMKLRSSQFFENCIVEIEKAIEEVKELMKGEKDNYFFNFAFYYLYHFKFLILDILRYADNDEEGLTKEKSEQIFKNFPEIITEYPNFALLLADALNRSIMARVYAIQIFDRLSRKKDLNKNLKAEIFFRKALYLLKSRGWEEAGDYYKKCYKLNKSEIKYLFTSKMNKYRFYERIPLLKGFINFINGIEIEDIEDFLPSEIKYIKSIFECTYSGYLYEYEWSSERIDKEFPEYYQFALKLRQYYYDNRNDILIENVVLHASSAKLLGKDLYEVYSKLLFPKSNQFWIPI